MAQMTETQAGSISLGHLLNEHVRDMQGQDIGKVEDLILDTGSGTIDFAIVRFGGFLGMGGTYHLIPWPIVSVDVEQRTFTMDVTKEQVERAPSFDRSSVPKTNDLDYLDSVFQYWGIDRSMQHERMTQAQYGDQRATLGGQQSTSGLGESDVGSDMGSTESQGTMGGYSGQERRSPQSMGYMGQERRSQQMYAEQTGMTGGEQQPSTTTGQGYESSQPQQRDVSYGGGMFGPERRNTGLRDMGWTGTERRAGW